MFYPKNTLLSVALCASLIIPTQASNKMDEKRSANSNSLTMPAATFVWDPEIIKAAKLENANNPLMSLTIWPLQQLCQILTENGHADAIATLGKTSIHLAGRILRRVGEYDNPTIRQAIRRDLCHAIVMREQALTTLENTPQAQPQDQPKALLLAPWKELLGNNASLQHFIWARQMLKSENVARLKQNELQELLLIHVKDKTKSLALGSYAAEIFPKGVCGWSDVFIIAAVCQSLHPPAEFLRVVQRCTPLVTGDLEGWGRAWIIAETFPLTDQQIAKIAEECSKRPQQEKCWDRVCFVQKRARELREGK